MEKLIVSIIKNNLLGRYQQKRKLLMAHNNQLFSYAYDEKNLIARGTGTVASC
jgi:hypothetical protein